MSYELSRSAWTMSYELNRNAKIVFSEAVHFEFAIVIGGVVALKQQHHGVLADHRFQI